MRSLPLLLAFACLVAPSAVRAQDYFVGGGDEGDDTGDAPRADQELLDAHLTMHIAANGVAGSFGTVSIALGIERFSQRQIFPGLTFSLWGLATVISSVTSTESAFRQWSSVRPALEKASETELRLYRIREADRLTRLAINQSIGLAADGASLAIGIVLLATPGVQGGAGDLGTSLALNGAFLLAVDGFRTGLDDQVARRWRARNLVAERGYFGDRAPRLRGLAGLAPFAAPVGGPGRPLAPGGVAGVVGVF